MIGNGLDKYKRTRSWRMKKKTEDGAGLHSQQQQFSSSPVESLLLGGVQDSSSDEKLLELGPIKLKLLFFHFLSLNFIKNERTKEEIINYSWCIV